MESLVLLLSVDGVIAEERVELVTNLQRSKIRSGRVEIKDQSRLFGNSLEEVRSSVVLVMVSEEFLSLFVRELGYLEKIRDQELEIKDQLTNSLVFSLSSSHSSPSLKSFLQPISVEYADLLFENGFSNN